MRPAWLRIPSRAGSPAAVADPPLALELFALGAADGLLAGDTVSVFRGSGVEADGVRPYVVGDDVRAMDWRVTARTGRPHVRELVEERGVEVHIVVDRSASLHAGVSGRPGYSAVQAAAALAAAAVRQGHPVGLLQVTDRAESQIPPGQHRQQLRWILTALERLAPQGRGTSLAPALRALSGYAAGRAMVILISDFRVPSEARAEIGPALARVAGRHDLIPVRIRTPGPEDLPPVGLVGLTDPESGRRVTVDTSRADVRLRLREAAAEEEAWWDSLWAGLRVRPVEVDPSRPVGPQLREGLLRRGGRAA